MSDPNFYRAFEDLHRGSRALIQSRQEVYLPFVSALAAVYPQAPMLDLGCGRGEWLELLQARAIRAHGVDLDEGMLQACREHGLDARHGDAIDYLRAQPDASHAAVSAFHVAEHLPMDVLQALIREALRVLLPGGLLILETPNPENLVVATVGFYMDPTHVRPLPPDLLAFLPRFEGFGRTRILRLQQASALTGGAPVALIDVLAGVSPDYAVVAQKQPEAFPAGEHAEALEEAFSREHGVTLNGLADRLDAQWGHRFWELGEAIETSRTAARVAEVSAATAARRAAASEDRVAASELRSAAAEQRAAAAEQQAAAAALQAAEARGHADAIRGQLAEFNGLQREIVALHQQLIAMRQSRSWGITRPLRWITEQRNALREQGWRERLRRLAVRLGLAAGDGATQAHAEGSPAAEPAAQGEPSRETEVPGQATVPDTAPAPTAEPMSAQARQVRDELLRARTAREAAARKL